MNTQPTYQVPTAKLIEAEARLASLGFPDVQARPFLFLCGLRFTHSYFVTSHQGTDKRATWYSAGHLIDDGLNDASRLGLKTLLKRARSRAMRSEFPAELLEGRNADWLFLSLALVSLDSDLPPTVSSWLSVGDKKLNWVRLSFGMGVRSHWDATKYVVKVMRGPFGFANAEQKDVTLEVKRLLDSFLWNPEWVVPEI